MPIQMKKVKESEVTQSCPTLCNPMDCSLPSSSFHGIFQARILEMKLGHKKEEHCQGYSELRLISGNLVPKFMLFKDPGPHMQLDSNSYLQSYVTAKNTNL